MKAWIGVVALVGLAACNHAVADGNDLLKQSQAMGDLSTAMVRKVAATGLDTVWG